MSDEPEPGTAEWFRQLNPKPDPDLVRDIAEAASQPGQ